MEIRCSWKIEKIKEFENMSIDIKSVSIKPKRETFGHVARRIGEGKSASRYERGYI